ncbi:CheR family methyltransferase [Jannaschia seohaensis]|uniref:protein-glutamate O-methyltransferase n=1 Tax=Jannaschia seohaensis TaxID=475081 RepID=A0A2Y9C0U3_9RHOB|nr:CheR family methyltransferase [Jannaschia seohaensis]PWJ18341.1 chemotaxis protein methyltransferase CheR/two-component system CheB/CheR fusion protein [Jannaschia seohaensis]SSA46872.1 chemotaxis protein methyltransferase CheR/two-component system, chemotaxis family, CheB/CheR fusion protein [Jannaschia seohaensis]
MTTNEGSDPPRGLAAVSRPGEGGSGAGGRPDHAPTPIVAIAAAAGGLEAVAHLIRGLPHALGAAYVLALKLPSTARSPIPTLLADETGLGILELTEPTVPQPGLIYVPPAGMDVVIEGDRISPRAPAPGRETPAPSGDRLFGSLARERGAAATGIVLSGRGSDGTYGVQAIREVGGVTIAQRPETARHDDMPRSAIEMGCIDLVLDPQEIGRHLDRLARVPADRLAQALEEDQRGALGELMDLLLARTGVDFRDYRANTVRRRLARRMAARAMDRIETYVAHCRTNGAELEALHRDLLISVTWFFRDRDAFEALGHALKLRLGLLPPGAPVRVWVAGCATGEEAYSIAILVAEALGGPDAVEAREVAIFATDIDDRALAVARRGVYPLSALDDVPAGFGEKYFFARRGRLEVAPLLRRMVRFSRHNVFQDPPFLDLDLVTLRNVLIYFKASLQEQVLARMHFALREGGLLTLGASETLNAPPFSFEEATEGGALVKTGPHPATAAEMGFDARPGAAERQAMGQMPLESGAADPPHDPAAFEPLARAVAPDGFVMSRTGEILRVLGDISGITGLSETKTPALDSSILRPPLRAEVTSLAASVIRMRGMREGQWHVLDAGAVEEVRLDAYPISDGDGPVTRVLFALRRRPAPALAPFQDGIGLIEGAGPFRGPDGPDGRSDATPSVLRQTIERLRANIEELHAVNEELQSSNEEIQTVNEELETANEELRSTNEELITINEEMQIKAGALRAARIDMDAILESLPFAVAVIDRDMTLRGASPRARELFGLPALSPAGAPLARYAPPDRSEALIEMVRKALENGAPQGAEMPSGDSVWRMRAVPHAGPPGSGSRALLFVDEAGLDRRPDKRFVQ